MSKVFYWVKKIYLIFNNQGSDEKISSDYEKIEKFSTFLGIIKIINEKFLFMVEDVYLKCLISNSEIFEIQSITCIPFNVKRN